MKRFRIVYWFSSITTERYISANSKDEALEKFAQWSDKKIVSIEEVQ